MARWSGVLGAVLLTVVSSVAPLEQQTPPEGVPPVVRSVDVAITDVDVVVIDRKGERVSGLDREDFEVRQDGAVQPITNFYAVEGGTLRFSPEEALPTPPPSARGATPPAASPAVPPAQTRMVIFVDNLHLSVGGRNRILQRLEGWVSALKPDVEIMVAALDHSLHVTRRFSSDQKDTVATLRRLETTSALKSATERPELIRRIDEAPTEREAALLVRRYAQGLDNELQSTFEGLRRVLAELDGFDGRKVLLHVSEGLPQSPAAEMWKYVADRFHSFATQLESVSLDRSRSFDAIADVANAAGVSLYTFDASGLGVDDNLVPESGQRLARVDTFLDRTNLQSMLRTIAEATGGAAVVNENDAGVVLREIERDITSYYSLGYPTVRTASRGPHRLDVKVKRKGLTVRVRRSVGEGRKRS